MRDLKRAGTGLCTKEEQVLELSHTENKIHTFQALVSALARCCGRAQEPMLRPPATAAAEMWSPAAMCLLPCEVRLNNPLPAEIDSKKTLSFRNIGFHTVLAQR